MKIVSWLYDSNFSAVIGFKCPSKVPAHTQSAKFWPFPRFAVPGDCHHLITCVEGQPRLISCGEGKVFDDQNLTCEDPELVPHCSHGHKWLYKFVEIGLQGMVFKMNGEMCRINHRIESLVHRVTEYLSVGQTPTKKIC